MIKKLFVYGSFRNGGSRSSMFPACKSATRTKLEGMLMYAFKEVGYPGATITNNKNDYIVGDVLDFSNVPDEEWRILLIYLDRIEGVGFGLFKRAKVKTPVGPAWIYLFSHKQMLEEFEQKYKQEKKSLPMIRDWAEIDPSVE